VSDKDELYSEFLKDLGALDDFLDVSRQAPPETEEDGVPPVAFLSASPPNVNSLRQQRIPLSRYDPDVRRLLEAVAFFSARTRRLAVTGLQKAVDRINAGNLDFLLRPMPAMTLVRVSAKAAGSLKYGLPELPMGTEVRITTPTKAVGYFTTTRPLKIWPLTATTEVDPSGTGKPDMLPGGRFRLTVTVKSPAVNKTKDVVDRLSFHIDYRDDYARSRRLVALLEHGLRVTVQFDGEGPLHPCKASVGPPVTRASATSRGSTHPADAPELDELAHPLERVRSFFHLPAQNLFLNVILPTPPIPWQKATFFLEGEQNWPNDLVVSHDTFQLFVVPVTNLRKAPASPIVCDGTKEAYPIRGSNPAAFGTGVDLKGEETRLHSVLGVYKLTARGLSPLQSALVAAGEWTYDLEVEGTDPDRLLHRLLVQCPSAFGKPETVSVEALWYQPQFDTIAAGQLTVDLQRMRIDGAAFALCESLRPHRPSRYFNDPLRLLHVLGLRTKKAIEKDDLMSLLEGLGLDAESKHAAVIGKVGSITAQEIPETRLRTGGMAMIYDVAMLPWPAEEQGLVDDFRRQLQAVLQAWLPCGVTVRVTPQTAQLASGDPS
jgi:type VI secretion system protein ImpG